MAADNKRLARGLSSVLSSAYQKPSERLTELTHVPAAGHEPGAWTVPVDAIQSNPYQPRREMDDQNLDVLVQSIKRNGVLQPVVVRQKDGAYELVAGHRRLVAARRAGLAALPAVVREASDEEMLELALIENIHREDLNCIDRAMAYRQYRERFGLTPEQIGDRVGEDRSTVANYLRLLALPDTVHGMLASGRLGMGQARAILGLSDPLEQIRLATRSVDQELSVRKVEQLVRELRDGGGAPVAKAEPRPLVRSLENAFGAAVGLKVHIVEGRKKNTGKVVIRYKSLEDFDRLSEQFGVQLEAE